jgi:hypothetical protein
MKRILLAPSTLLGASVVLVCLGGPVFAHHGFETEYDSTKVIEATGVVSKIEWTNPHMHLYVDVADKAGKVTTYNLELTSPNAVQRQGWTKNDLVPGEKVAFKAHAGKVVEERAALDSLVKAGAPNQEIFKGQRPDDLGSN